MRTRLSSATWPLLLVAATLPVRAEDLALRAAESELSRRYDDDVLRRAAAAPDAGVRRAAARAAARLRDPRSLPWLVPLLADDAGPVRRTALFALGQVAADPAAAGAAPATLVLTLRAALRNAAPSDLPFALEALGKTGDARAVAEVVRRGDDDRAVYLGHEDAHVRGEAALALFRLGDPSALPDLFAALAGEEDPEARWRMVYAAWRLLRTRATAAGAATAWPRWCELLRASSAPDRPTHERVFAVRALGSIDGQRDAVLALLEDEDARIVVEAIRGTTRPWDAETARRVSVHASHADALVREAVVDHLVAGGAEAVALLRAAAGHVADLPREHGKVRAALAAAGEETPPLPEDADGGPGQREETLWQVRSHAPDRLPPDLPATVAGRMAAADVLGEERVPAAAALDRLAALLATEDFVVQSLAIGSLARRGAKDQVPAIVAAARKATGSGRQDVRIAAAEALKDLQVVDPWLEEAASDPDAPVRLAARDALEALGRDAPPAPPPSGFRLHGHDAAGILKAAKGLAGARVVFETDRGEIEMMLLPDEAPAHCVNLAVLVSEGFYDGKTWHRVVGNFVIQGGCPRGDGWGGPGYQLPDEIALRTRYVRGTVGMPKAGDDTGGCQVFVTHLPAPHLDGRYSIFAQVVRGFDVVDRIRVGDRITKARLRVPRGG